MRCPCPLQESAACFSGEVKDPSRDYPLGMFLAILLVFVTLFVPILIATGASDLPYDQWTDGYFVTLGKEIGGPWLSYWLMFGAALSNIGMFEAEMSSDSWQVAGTQCYHITNQQHNLETVTLRAQCVVLVPLLPPVFFCCLSIGVVWSAG